MDFSNIIESKEMITYCDEFVFQPVVILNCLWYSEFFTTNNSFTVSNIWVLCWGMVTPDDGVEYCIIGNTQSVGNLQLVMSYETA